MAKTSYNSELFKFAVFPNFDQAITFLADTLADKEDWDFSDTTTKSNGILKNYLEFTFRKLLQEKKVRFTTDNKFACYPPYVLFMNYSKGKESLLLFRQNGITLQLL